MPRSFAIACAALVFAAFPAFAFAATLPAVDLVSIMGILKPIVWSLISISFFLALLGFFWGIAMFIWNAGNEKRRAEGRNIMMWGLITLFVMLSILGILNALQVTFQVQGNNTLTPPNPNLSAY